MKTLKTIILFIGTTLTILGQNQSQDEKDIRRLDSLEVISFLKADTVTLEKSIWSANYVVANPFNKIVSIPQIKALMRNQKIAQAVFVRTIEKITFNQNVAIVMGIEVPDKSSASEGVAQNVLFKRRFTNIWMKNKSQWRLIARQASNIE
jgi:hypothetical protein